MRRAIFAVVVIGLLLAGCAGGGAGGDAAAKAVEVYLQALVSKQPEQLPSLVCAEWEESAVMELDSFQAVAAELEGVSCAEMGADGNAKLVKCQGAIVATYNDEKQRLELSPRTYRVVQEGGEWRMCGYK